MAGIIPLSNQLSIKLARPPAIRAVNTLDSKLAKEVVEGLLKYSFIEQASIEDELSEQLALATTLFEPSKTQWLTSSFTSETKTYQTLLEYSGNSDLKPGIMTLRVNMDSALAPFYERSQVVFYSGLARNFFLSFLLFILFYFVLAKPLKKLAVQFNKVKVGGKTKLTVPESHKNSELGVLANAANSFVNKVELLVLDQIKAEETLTQSKQRLLKLIDQIPQLILAQDNDGNILFANESCSLFYQMSKKDLQGKTLSDIHHHCPEEIIVLDNIRHLVSQQNESTHQQEIHLTSTKGEANTFTIQVAPFDDFNQSATLLVASNISAQKEIQKHIEQLASHDALTGLPNRLLFNDRLEHVIANSQRDGHFNAILFLDLDHFKNINDSLGHLEGDKLLVHVAKVLQNTVRINDTVARMGGDEFVILLENLSKDSNQAQITTQDITNKILEQFSAPMSVDEHIHHIGASIGIVIFPMDGENVTDLMRYADTAMYQAKSSGRKQAVFYEASMSALVEYRQSMENQLHQALREQQFVVYFQPQVDSDGGIYGFEALIRWQHPERGLVAPSEFIPILESSGLIVPVSDWLMGFCCQKILDWQHSGFWQENWHIAINVSPLQFYQEQFVETLAEKINVAGLHGSCICLEITETVAIKNVAFTSARLAEIKALGMVVALDDFGTGYSSLSYLKDFPIDILKIDRSFIQELDHKSKDKSIVEAIIAMAKVLELTVICEGVETELQVNIASSCGSEYFQGYYYCRPVSADSLDSSYSK